MKRAYLIAALVFMLGFTGFAQTDRAGLKILYTRELTITPFKIHSAGFGINFRYGKSITAKKKKLMEFEIGEMRHHKEYKRPNELIPRVFGFPSPKAYVFEKQNSFFTVRTGIGRMRTIFDKAERNGVQVRLAYFGGFTLGVLKAYYLDILYEVNTSGPVKYRIVHEKYDADIPDVENRFLQWENIYGASGFSYGLTELKFVPGVYTKMGLNFEWASYEDIVKALEVGAIIDFFPKAVPIMILSKNKFFFPTLYIDIKFGWRWE